MSRLYLQQQEKKVRDHKVSVANDQGLSYWLTWEQ